MKKHDSAIASKVMGKFSIQLLITFAATILLVAGINVAFAEPIWRSKPVQCGNPDTLLQLLDEAGEKAIVGALTDLRQQGSNISDLNPIYFFANTNTGTFTIIEYHLSAQEVCVVGYGQGLDFDVQNLFEKKTES